MRAIHELKKDEKKYKHEKFWLHSYFKIKFFQLIGCNRLQRLSISKFYETTILEKLHLWSWKRLKIEFLKTININRITEMVSFWAR